MIFLIATFCFEGSCIAELCVLAGSPSARRLPRGTMPVEDAPDDAVGSLADDVEDLVIRSDPELRMTTWKHQRPDQSWFIWSSHARCDPCWPGPAPLLP